MSPESRDWRLYADDMLADKRALAGDLLEGGAEARLTEMSDADLLKTVSIDLDRALDEAA